MSQRLVEEAQKRRRNLRSRRRDPRYREVMGRLVEAGLIKTSDERIVPHRRPIQVKDALWASVAEPRVAELLPALVIKKPSLLVPDETLPADLESVVDAIQRARDLPGFRGVQPANYMKWVRELGHQGKTGSALKTFRFRPEEQRRLRRLKLALDARSEAEVLRIALERLELELKPVTK